jgi:chemotaxis protein CheY-P-specific phosphatase CheC
LRTLNSDKLSNILEEKTIYFVPSVNPDAIDAAFNIKNGEEVTIQKLMMIEMVKLEKTLLKI